MLKTMFIAIIAVLLGSCVVSQEVSATNSVLLGERHVSDRTEQDTIQVGKHRGKFSRLRVRATGSAVEFKRVAIHFENGTKQVREKNQLLRQTEGSATLDLDGGARYIDKVVFHYEARSWGWKGADIKLWGIR